MSYIPYESVRKRRAVSLLRGEQRSSLLLGPDGYDDSAGGGVVVLQGNVASSAAVVFSSPNSLSAADIGKRVAIAAVAGGVVELEPVVGDPATGEQVDLDDPLVIDKIKDNIGFTDIVGGLIGGSVGIIGAGGSALVSRNYVDSKLGPKGSSYRCRTAARLAVAP